MRYVVYTSQCSCPTICSSACDWRIAEDRLVSRGTALAFASNLVVGPKRTWARARVFAVGQTVGHLIAEYRQETSP